MPLRQYGYDEWQITEGLPDNNVIAITQTPDGYLWLGTNAGLSRFNGFEFANSTTDDCAFLPSNSVYSLLTTRDGTLWIGTSKGLGTRRRGGPVKPLPQIHGRLLVKNAQ